MKRVIKKIIRALLCLWSIIIFLPSVNAEVLYDYEGRLLNRSYDVFPFSTNYTSGEVTTYTNSNYVKLYGTNPQLNNPPRYLYVVYCATGNIDFNTTGVTYGNLSNNGSTIGGTCSTQGYSGNYYLNRWTIYDWYDASSSGTYEWLLQWNIKISNTLSYTIFVTVDSMFLSNELITDFGDSALLAEILQQNNSLRSSLNSIQSSVDSTNDSLSGVENAQKETNEKLDNIDSTIKDDSVTGATDSGSSFFDSFTTDTYGLSDVITMPLTLIKSLTSSTCVSLDLTIPFVNKQLSLPCMSSIYSRFFGDFFSLYQSVTFGFVAYWVIVRIFNLVKDFKNPDHDEIEVLDL